MSEIRSKPSSKQFRENFDRIFGKADRPSGETVTGSLRESSHDENIDLGSSGRQFKEALQRKWRGNKEKQFNASRKRRKRR